MLKRITKYHLITSFWIVILVLFGLSAYFPHDCSTLKTVTIGCQEEQSENQEALSAEDLDIKRIVHDAIPHQAYFQVQAEDTLSAVKVHFMYRHENAGDRKPFYVSFRHDTDWHHYSMGGHHLLHELTWPAVRNQNGPYLYQREPLFESIEDFQDRYKSIGGNIAADRIAAHQLNLDEGAYAALEDIADSFEGYDFILTSQAPVLRDGGWFSYEQVFNLESVAVNENEIEGMINILNQPEDTATLNHLLLGEVHIDYTKRN